MKFRIRMCFLWFRPMLPMYATLLLNPHVLSHTWAGFQFFVPSSLYSIVTAFTLSEAKHSSLKGLDRSNENCSSHFGFLQRHVGIISFMQTHRQQQPCTVQCAPAFARGNARIQSARPAPVVAGVAGVHHADAHTGLGLRERPLAYVCGLVCACAMRVVSLACTHARARGDFRGCAHLRQECLRPT
jgi:hypothetical protein